jgi:C4-dicarboxylate transporter DctQ subunit
MLHHYTRTALGRWVNALEETLIAAILGAMTLITFANVVARYVFNDNILWALEATAFLFAWLVLLGASYAMKVSAHLGVDAIIAMVSGGWKRILGLIAAAICVVFALLLMKGAWDFWAPFAELQPTTGRWFPTGIDEVRGQGWFEVNDIPMPAAVNQPVADVFNMGEPYEKMPRFIPYAILPLAMALFLFRCVQALIQVATGVRAQLIASHEVEDELYETAAHGHHREEGAR